jgi:hypothetical protein
MRILFILITPLDIYFINFLGVARGSTGRSVPYPGVCTTPWIGVVTVDAVLPRMSIRDEVKIDSR